MTRELQRVRRASANVARAYKEREEAIYAAHTAGASIRAIADEAGLSHQRVHQILRAREEVEEILRCASG